MSSTRYAVILPHKVSGRAEKRLLNRARACRFCGKPLGADRRLFAAIANMWHRELVAAHSACAEAENKRIAAEQEEQRRRMTPAHQLAMAGLLAEMMRVECELILGTRQPM